MPAVDGDHIRMGIGLGSDHYVRLGYLISGQIVYLGGCGPYPRTDDKRPVGMLWWHPSPPEDDTDDDWCAASTVFGTTHNIRAMSPFTITPSLLCPSCGCHGYIKDGRWIPA